MINFLNTLDATKIIALTDLLFLGSSSILMLVSGSYLTLKGCIKIASARPYITMILYSYILYIILTNNLTSIGLLFIDNSIIYTNLFKDNVVSIFNNLLALFVLVFFILLYAYASQRVTKFIFEYSLVLYISIMGMTLILFSTDLLIWFLAIEIQSFCLYTIAAYRSNRSYLQTEVGIKYFLFGSVASSLYLFGISIIYILLGSFDWSTIAVLSYFPLEHQYIFNISLVLIFISLFFKLGIAPFHIWLPTVYTHTSSIITYLFILLPKISLLYLLYRFASITSTQIFYLPIVLSLIIGTIFAFKATNLKTFFAYSSIGNMAFLLAPILYQANYSFYSLIFYVFTYNVLITVALIPIVFLKRSDNSNALANLRDLITLKKSNPFLSVTYVLMVLSFAGIPPLLGFFSKLFILLSALTSSAYLLTSLLLTFSVISCYYYLRLIKILYFSFSLKYASLGHLSLIPALTISVFTLINLWFLCCPTYLALILNY